jgi:uncharacterized membrane protein YphA (DoxX/SURF4 family)
MFIHGLMHHVWRSSLAAVFLMAAITKITDLHGFADRMVLHSGLPNSLAMILAGFLPWLELICGLSLALGIAVRESALLLLILLTAFFIYSILHPYQADCGCFLFPRPAGFLESGWWPPVRNVLLAFCSIWVMLVQEITSGRFLGAFHRIGKVCPLPAFLSKANSIYAGKTCEERTKHCALAGRQLLPIHHDPDEVLGL